MSADDVIRGGSRVAATIITKRSILDVAAALVLPLVIIEKHMSFYHFLVTNYDNDLAYVCFP